VEIVKLRFPFESLDPDSGRRLECHIAIGHFDGVHVGHQAVIGSAVESARRSGKQAAVMTFHPHPKEVLGRGERYGTALTPLEEKLRRFEALGIDTTYVVEFDHAFAAVSAEAFVMKVLRPLGVTAVVVGFDFTFGSRGMGTPELLRTLGAPDIHVDIIAPQALDEEKVSSSRIREALEQGDVQSASSLLGRPYRIEGTVVSGDRRGRTIGFPTANVEPDGNYLLPRLGVYAVRAHVGGRIYEAVLNLGVKPTFHDDLPEPKLEAHLFDFSHDVYGERMSIDFISFLRPEQKFGGIEQLVEQIRIDADRARAVLSTC
jgi:riboflavin kinase / FMN adenylyltransferase